MRAHGSGRVSGEWLDIENLCWRRTPSSSSDDDVRSWLAVLKIQLEMSKLSWQNTCERSIEQHYAACI
jgi:hypothetical protein